MIFFSTPKSGNRQELI